jgi:hypothetical protein
MNPVLLSRPPARPAGAGKPLNRRPLGRIITERMIYEKMKFIYGKIPDNQSFHPEAEGWLCIKEPDPIHLQLMAIPVMVAAIIIWGIIIIIWSLFNSVDIMESLLIIKLFPSLEFIIFLFISVPLHELMHALFHPGWGLSSETNLGLWLEKGLFFAHYDGIVTRNRFLLILLSPLIVMGIFPIIFMFFYPSLFNVLGIISLWGCLLACGDLVGVGIVVSQIPKSAIVRNKGWQTFWMAKP